MNINEILKNARLDKGLTRKFVAEKIGVSDGAIAHWENGHRNPSIQDFIKLVELLDLLPVVFPDYEIYKRVDKMAPYKDDKIEALKETIEAINLHRDILIERIEKLENRCVDGLAERIEELEESHKQIKVEVKNLGIQINRLNKMVVLGE